MKYILSILIVLLLSVLSFAQERNPSACKINNENWCGSGSLCGYAEDGSGAYVLTNAHVATTRIGDRMSCIFNMGGSSQRTFTGENLIAAYSNRDAVDWAIVFVPGLTADSGLKPVKLLKESPIGQVFQFTGSPRCIWPQSTVGIRLVNSNVPGVIMWRPPTIGGQSGSSVWQEVDSKPVSQILLTWIWGGNGAGQPTSLIWNNRQNRNAEGVKRPDGLELPPFPDQQNKAAAAVAQDRGLVEGYHEAQAVNKALNAVGVKELPIWHVKGEVEPPPEMDLTPDEKSAALALKDAGFDLVRIAEHYIGLMRPEQLSLNLPIVQPVSEFSYSADGVWKFAKVPGGFVAGTVYSGWKNGVSAKGKLEPQCVDGVCTHHIWVDQ